MIFVFVAFWASAFSHAQEFQEKTITFSVDLKQAVESNTLPSIQWVVPSLELTGSPTPEVLIEALVRSNHTITEISVIVKSGDQNRVQAVKLDDDYSKKIVLPVILFEGMNEIAIVVSNNKGGRVTSTKSIKYDKAALSNTIHVNRKDYALIFASDKYDNWRGLSNPIVGAEALAKTLGTDYGFQTELILNPSLSYINRKLAEYESRVYGSQDQLLVYFAGHGFFDQVSGGYIVAANSARNNPTATSLSQRNLRAQLDRLKCNHIFLVVDACKANMSDSKVDIPSAIELTQKEVVEKLGITTRKFMNLGLLEYASGNLPEIYSNFTIQLLESLKKKPSDKAPKTMAEIWSYFQGSDYRIGGFGSDNPQSDFLFLPK